MAGFGISGVEASGSATRVSYFSDPNLCLELIFF
jgi:hypothetical protein